MRKNLFILVLSCLFWNLFASEEELPPFPLAQGNFSLPTTTQIGPLVSFGQLLIEKNALLLQLTGFYVRSQNQYMNIIAPNIVYGIRDDLDVVLVVPFTPKSRSGTSHSSGMEDMILQLEYAFYARSYVDYVLAASIVANMQFPTGSSSKNPPTGAGSYSYFLGTTFVYQSINWYAFVSPGVNLPTSHHRTKFGNSYLYQCGCARYIQELSPTGWIFDFMIEVDGTYAKKDKILGRTDPNSGGNVILLTPSIWLSSLRWIVQLGVSIPIFQHLNGHQPKIKYALPYNFAVARQF